MTIRGIIEEHQARCQPYLVTLRMMMTADEGQVPAWRAGAEVIAATGAILAEAQAADREVRTASCGCREGTGPAALLQGRLNRLAAAAGDVINAADRGDHAQMIRHLRRFDALTSAIWTVQQAVFDPVPVRRLWGRTGVIRPAGKEPYPSARPCWQAGRHPLIPSHAQRVTASLSIPATKVICRPGGQY